MNLMLSRAAWARVVPFLIFMVVLAIRGHWPGSAAAWLDSRWVYGVAVVLVCASLWFHWPQYQELRQGPKLGWKGWLLSIVVGVVVFELWIRLTLPWMILGDPTATFRPVDEQGQLLWGLIIVRWIGAALMVPVMEELFWRSFLMRWIDQQDFETVAPKTVTFKAIAMSTFAFTLAHTLWLGAVVAGLAYAWLYKRTGSIWAPIVAHAVTNGVLGIWVVVWGNWAFW